MFQVYAERRVDNTYVPGGKLRLHSFSDMSYALIYSDARVCLCSRISNVHIESMDNMHIRLESDNQGTHVIRTITTSDFKQLIEALQLCRDICETTLCLNIVARDLFFDGVRSCGGLEKETVLGDLESFLSNCTSSLISSLKSESGGSNTTAHGVAPSVKLNFSKTECVYCYKKEDGRGTFTLKVHPYVPVDFDLNVLYFCPTCRKNFMNYRAQAVRHNLLVLPGEYNEELCACCADSPTKLVLCAQCPRSFCNGCLLHLLSNKAYVAMDTQENWVCMCCVRGEEEFAAVTSRLSLRLPLLGDLSDHTNVSATVEKTEPSPVSSSVTAAIQNSVITDPEKLDRLDSQRSSEAERSTPSKGKDKTFPLKNVDIESPGKSVTGSNTPVKKRKRERSVAVGRPRNGPSSSKNSGYHTQTNGKSSEDYTSTTNECIGRRVSKRERPLSRKAIERFSTEDLFDKLGRKQNRARRSVPNKTCPTVAPVADKSPSKATASETELTNNTILTSNSALASTSTIALPPVDPEFDEVFYFSQYADYLDAQPSEGMRNTEDFCYLCKDGGDLVECDHCRGIPGAHCLKVYHEYCLGFSVVDGSLWQCFSHFCGLCGALEPPLSCKYCPNSFCEECLRKWSKTNGHGAYAVLSTPSKSVELADDDTVRHTGPKKRGRRKKKPRAATNIVSIICGGCLNMIERCKGRGVWNDNRKMGELVHLPCLKEDNGNEGESKLECSVGWDVIPVDSSATANRSNTETSRHHCPTDAYHIDNVAPVAPPSSSATHLTQQEQSQTTDTCNVATEFFTEAHSSITSKVSALANSITAGLNVQSSSTFSDLVLPPSNIPPVSSVCKGVSSTVMNIEKKDDPSSKPCDTKPHPQRPPIPVKGSGIIANHSLMTSELC